MAYRCSQTGGRNELQLLAYTPPCQCQIRASSVTYPAAYSSGGSLTQSGARDQTASLWILIRFVSAGGTPALHFRGGETEVRRKKGVSSRPHCLEGADLSGSRVLMKQSCLMVQARCPPPLAEAPRTVSPGSLTTVPTWLTLGRWDDF